MRKINQVNDINRRFFFKYLSIIPLSFLNFANPILANEKTTSNFEEKFIEYNGWQLASKDIETLKNDV
ncbi:MAG: hypothetical protein ACJ0BI_04685 [Paracoccaceae bacterium]